MSGGCKVCGYLGGPAPGHIEHAHAVALAGARLLAEQGERHKRTIAVLSGQRKNAMIMRLRGELAQAMRTLEALPGSLKGKALGLSA